MAPDVWLRLVIAGAAPTVNGEPLLGAPKTVTTTLPLVEPTGTTTTMLVALQLVTEITGVALNVTVLAPCEAPKAVPAMVTDEPMLPMFGVRLLIAGARITVNGEPLLAVPNTVTTTLPVVTPAGTTTTMLVALQLV